MEKQKKKKMIIIGLDNAGKSTILLTLQKQLNLKTISKLQPTKGVVTEEYEGVDSIYQVWDFGGQERYRKQYLLKPDYFGKTDRLVFIIDIQDPERYESALTYLENILTLLKNMGESSEFIIFLHKFDPDLLDSEEFQLRSRNLIEQLQKFFIGYEFPVKIYHTSVYFFFQRIQVI